MSEDPAILHPDVLISPLAETFIVRDKNKGRPGALALIVKHVHDFPSCYGVEVSCRFIRQ